MILHGQAWHLLAAASGATRRRLFAVLDQVSANPFRVGDMQQREPGGSINEVVLIDAWLVTYWADHAAREIRVVALELADDGR